MSFFDATHATPSPPGRGRGRSRELRRVRGRGQRELRRNGRGHRPDARCGWGRARMDSTVTTDRRSQSSNGREAEVLEEERLLRFFFSLSGTLLLDPVGHSVFFLYLLGIIWGTFIGDILCYPYLKPKRASAFCESSWVSGRSKVARSDRPSDCLSFDT